MYENNNMVIFGKQNIAYVNHFKSYWLFDNEDVV